MPYDDVCARVYGVQDVYRCRRHCILRSADVSRLFGNGMAPAAEPRTGRPSSTRDDEQAGYWRSRRVTDSM